MGTRRTTSTLLSAPVLIAILHAEAGPGAGPLTLATIDARRSLADRHAAGFREAGATRVVVVAGPPDDRPFGSRLRELAGEAGDGGLVVLGSGAIPLATLADRRRFVAAAADTKPGALANNRYSADVVAIACAGSVLAALPDLDTDNALPRWLAEAARIPVTDLRRTTRLGVDIDGALDLVLLGGRWTSALDPDARSAATSALEDLRAVASHASAELVVAGRFSSRTLAWLEANTASRTRALVEERGLRTRRPGQRPARSVLGMLLDRDGPESLGRHLAELGDAAIVDTRVLLAHRFGAAESGWPGSEDRFASDLLLPDRVDGPWLRAVTSSAVEAPIPILFGGHTLVGPGLRLALGRRRSPARRRR
jgi:hypothetical protein